MPTCMACHKKTGNHFICSGKKIWHIDCLMCHACHKRIDDKQFIILDNKTLHKKCLMCSGCNKNINKHYITYQGNLWHADCFERKERPKCSVCLKGLSDRYLVDFWGNAFCDSHKNYKTCNSCSRIICKNLTDGGMQYPDGIAICNICNLYSVSTLEQAKPIYNEMKQSLASIGLHLNNASVPLLLCDRASLHQHSRHDFHKERPILGLAQWVTTSSGGVVVNRHFKQILIQKDLPEEHFRTIAIHELMHAWFFYHQYFDLPLYIEEGFCVLMEYIWLKHQKNQASQYRLLIIEQSRDPIYGDGFQQVKKALEVMPLMQLLAFVKDKKKLPNKFSAFFY
ncbi:hypothetical protein CI610_03334 [invertebrate metagenome]|uniref:LIM zinc-binding domain-containing protein n=1 Tax=invertebrate metagenome TaxID=1711999 RepID=A0A2H9T3D0_9ZZZZ